MSRRRIVKQRVFIVVGAFPNPARNGNKKQAERIYDAVKAVGNRGTTKEDIYQQLGDVPLNNIAYYLNEMAKTGVLHELGATPRAPRAVSLDALREAFLTSFETLVKATAAARQLNTDADAHFATYAKVKEAYVGRLSATDGGTVNEKETAFRLAVINAAKTIL